MRQVVVRALTHAAANGLPGEHHFYVTFRTDHPGVVMPPRLRAQYPQEMTIVLQHQFWDLKMDAGGRTVQCRPVVRWRARGAGDSARRGDRFRGPVRALRAAVPAGPVAEFVDEAAEPEPSDKPAEKPQVVSFDAFRRRPPKS